MLVDLADNLGLVRSLPTTQVPTHYTPNKNQANSVIDLIFTKNQDCYHTIEPTMRLTLDHAPLITTISILQEEIQCMTSGIPEDSEEENDFIKYIITNLQHIDFSNISDIPELEGKVSQLGTTLVEAWNKYAKVKNIVNQSKKWWNQECSSTLEDYRRTHDPQNWKAFKKATKKAKQTFFDERITEIATTNKHPWDLMG